MDSAGFGQGSEGCNNHFVVPDGESGEHAQGHNDFFVDDVWACRLAASLRHLDTHHGAEVLFAYTTM